MKGPLSAEQARRYLLCIEEGVKGGDLLYLLQDVKIEVGKGTPFKELPFQNRPGTADPEGLVYQIRGSFKKYQCDSQETTGRFMNVGRNCRIYDEQKADGSCFRDNFGEWQCQLYGSSGTRATSGQPPPK